MHGGVPVSTRGDTFKAAGLPMCELEGCDRLGITELGGKRYCLTHKEKIIAEGLKLIEQAQAIGEDA